MDEILSKNIQERLLRLEKQVSAFVEIVQAQGKQIEDLLKNSSKNSDLVTSNNRIDVLTSESKIFRQSFSSFVEDQGNRIRLANQAISNILERISKIEISLENDARSIERHFASICEIQQKLGSLNSDHLSNKSNISDIDSRSLNLSKDIQQLKQVIANLNSSQQVSQVDIKNLAQAIDKINASFSSLMEEKVKMVMDAESRCNNKIKFLSAILTKSISDLKDSIAQTISKGSYDGQIAELKRDMATVLSVVHSTASNSPDSAKMEAKVKTLETSIAQIYELLKKYETR